MKAEIQRAAQRIREHVRVTPVIEVEGKTSGQSRPVMLKLELLQHTGSFKPRGAFNRMLSATIPDAGVIAASGGNHGAAVAYAARELGVTAEVFVPRSTPAAKLARIRGFGASVHQVGDQYAEAYVAMLERAHSTGAMVVHAYDQEAVVVGQGTLGLELESQVDSVDAVFVAVGGGGLIGGIASWFENRVEVIGVEPETCSTLHSAMEAGNPVDVPVSGLAADSLGARRIGVIAFEVAQRHVSEVILVSDEEIRRAQGLLWERLRIVTEPGGAAALAGLLSGRHSLRPESRVAVIVCGGNVER